MSCAKPFPAVRLWLFTVVTACAAPAAAFYPATHAEIVSRAVSRLCEKGPDSPLCAELRSNLAFLEFGARMEDSGYEGFSTVHNGELFYDEELPGTYGPCSTQLSGKKPKPSCNHFFFVNNYLESGTREGSCGSTILDATSPDCKGKKPFQWESSRQRALRLWKERVIPYHSGAVSRARVYYWLGRTAHLLADAGVPGHVIPHGLDKLEFEHRAYEKAAVDSPYKEGALSAVPPGDINGLFTRLALLTIATDTQARKPDPAAAHSDREKGFIDEEFSDWVADILSLHPYVRRELALARETSGMLKPVVVAFTEKLFEIFGAQAGLVPACVEVPPVLEHAGPPFPLPDFDGRRLLP